MSFLFPALRDDGTTTILTATIEATTTLAATTEATITTHTVASATTAAPKTAITSLCAAFRELSDNEIVALVGVTVCVITFTIIALLVFIGLWWRGRREQIHYERMIHHNAMAMGHMD